MDERTSMVTAMQVQLVSWPHLNGPQHAADRELLLVMAEAVDAARNAVAEGAAALPLINACRYLSDVVRKLAPGPAVADDGFDAAMEWED